MKNLIIAVSLLCNAMIISAQEDYASVLRGANSIDTSLAKNYRVNFAVADQPAFEMLGNEPSEILRPTTVNELSLAVSKFYDGGKVVLPQSFGLEISPFILFGSKGITLEQYNKNYLWYNLRLSVGTGTDTSFGQNRRNAAVGFQWTVLDKGDLRKDGNLRNELIAFNAAYLAEVDSIEKKYGSLLPDDTIKRKQKAKEQENLNKIRSEEVEIIKKKYARDNWTKQKLTFAGAMLFSSKDSLAKNLKARTIGLWGTYAQPMGKNIQLLLGINGKINVADTTVIVSSDTTIQSDSSLVINNQTKKKANNTGSFSAGLRIYGGLNNVKAYTEFSYKVIPFEKLHKLVVQAGMEVKIVSSLWATINLAYELNKPFKGKQEGRFLPQLDIRWQIPDNFKLF